MFVVHIVDNYPVSHSNPNEHTPNDNMKLKHFFYWKCDLAQARFEARVAVGI